MKVLVTGAAGRLGSAVCTALVAQGFDVRGTDRRTRRDLPVKITVANLLEREACYNLLDGMDAVVHLANHPNAYAAAPQVLLGENVTINMNVFQAALEIGVRKVLFASTIQVINGDRLLLNRTKTPARSGLPYLPIDGETPADPVNPYSLSKRASELILERYLARQEGFSCVAVRFPALVSKPLPEWMVVRRARGIDQWTLLDECFSYLMLSDAGTLVAAMLKADLPGYRVYLPAARDPWLKAPIPEIVARYFPEVPVRKPVGELTGLVDNSRITAETGWVPQDVIEG